jgi:hypothetical protein
MRPILVLALVLAAIAALLFGVFSLTKDSPAPPPVSVPATTKPVDSKPQPAAPVNESESKNRTASTLAKPDESSRAPAVSGAQASIFNNSLTGMVRNAQGAALKDVEVTLSTIPTPGEIFFLQDVDQKANPDTTVRTNGDGKFAFKNIPPRSHYTLVAKHPEYARKEIQSVTVGQEGEFEEPPIVMSSGATLTGKVRDEQNNLIPDATLFLDGSQFQGAAFLPPDRMVVKTDHDGVFTFKNVQRGERMLTVSAPGYGRQNINNVRFEKDETSTRDIVLRTAEMIIGRVVGPDNQGLAKVLVIAVGFNGAQQTGRDQVTSNDQGEFTFEDLSPGDYNVIAQLKGYRLEKPAHTHTNGDRLILEMLKEASVCGTVVDASTNAPIADFACRVRNYYGPGQATAPNDNAFQPFQSAKGEYCVEGVQQSEYVVEATAAGYAPSLSSPFTVVAGKNVQGIVVRMSHGGVMIGRVVDPDGKPVARARITTHDNDWTDDEFTRSLGLGMPTATTPVDMRTDNEGRFKIQNLTPAVYQLVVEAQGFTNHVLHDVNVTDGAEAQVGDIKMTRGGSLRGTLFDPAGKPLSGGTISLRPAPNSGLMVYYDVKSGQDGKFLFANVQPGTYVLSGSRGGGGEANPLEIFKDVHASQKQVTIADDESKVLDLPLSE